MPLSYLSCHRSVQCLHKHVTSVVNLSKTIKLAMFSPNYRPEIMAGRQGGRTWSHSATPPQPYRSQMSPNIRPYGPPRPVPQYIQENPCWACKCGDLRSEHAGMVVEIGGRVQNIRVNRFLLLRDETGVTQLVIPDGRPDLLRKLTKIHLESYIKVVGEVGLRPAQSRHYKMDTGLVEVAVKEFVQVQNKRRDGCDDNGTTKKSRQEAKQITTDEMMKAPSVQMRSYFAARTATCGDLDELSPQDAVSLCGWVLAKRMDRFIALKDGYGEIQLVPSTEMTEEFKSVQVGDVLFVKGILLRRPFGTTNPRVPNGYFELAVTDLQTISDQSVPCPPPKAASPVSASDGGFNDDGDNGDESADVTLEISRGNEIQTELSKYTSRTHTCGELRSSHVGESVVLMGWVEFVRLSKFLLLRDGYGTTQVLVPETYKEGQDLMDKVQLESIIKVTGTVCSRPPAQINTKDYETGEIEVLALKVEVVNEVTKALPFSVRNYKKAKESLRMQHRYLDLRFKSMQRNLRLRSQVLMKMREFLINHAGFVEVETPTLFKRTPGGAREFVVPTHQAGLFYSLVQSPQQLKQLLMVGAMDRYFQVARCYRDETTRFDRQPEFTQMDIELSFCTEEDVMELIEDLLVHSWSGDGTIQAPFPRMTYDQAMETYGSDKPDLRFDWKFTDLTDVLRSKDCGESKDGLKAKFDCNDFVTYAFAAPKTSVIYSGSFKKLLEDQMRQGGPLTTPIVVSCKDTDDSKLVSVFGTAYSDLIKSHLHASNDAVVVLSVGPKQSVLETLGRARTFVAESMEEKGFAVRSSGNHLLWVTDFPLFTACENGQLESSHHPFTAPKPEHLSMLFTEPLKVTGQHYDLVLNGSEIGGGSIRIHDGKMQEDILTKILKLPTDSLTHLLDALKHGAPPHGGIALGMDRLIATMVGASSIKDVIAFPKTLDGKDLMTGAPCVLTEDEKKYYHLHTNAAPDS